MKNVFTITPYLPFLETLGSFLLEKNKDTPLSLAKTVIFLPTRRACKGLREAFLNLTEGNPLLLPRFIAFSDMSALQENNEFSLFDDDLDIPPSIPSLRRRFLLSRLIQARPTQTSLSAEKALSLADSLANLLDEGYIENIDFSLLEDLVPNDFASHWQETLSFLEIITKQWPEILKNLGMIDEKDRQIRILKAQSEFWKKNPPDFPVLVAGSTGSQPFIADFLDTVSSLEKGMVVLPGLDMILEEESFLLSEPSDPQYDLKSLLEKMNLTRKDVLILDKVFPLFKPLDPQTKAQEERLALISNALRPATTTELWRKNIQEEELYENQSPSSEATSFPLVEGLEELVCATKQEEALCIALILRQTLEESEKTAALITPDRELARRVIAQMTRWGVTLDDSAGLNLTLTSLGSFLLLLAQACLSDWKSLDLLACLKHPLALSGKDFFSFRNFVRDLERFCLRGVCLKKGFTGLEEIVKKRDEENPSSPLLLPFLNDVKACVLDFTDLMTIQEPQYLSVFLKAHIKAAESLATSHDRTGQERLWSQEESQTLSQFLINLEQESDTLDPLLPFEYLCLLTSLLKGINVRPKYGMHSRLDILGTIESRLIQADVVIIAGLNEGVFPKQPSPSAWLSRPMRQQCGLSAPEKKISALAHDFFLAFLAKKVVLSRSRKEGSAPSVQSRWLSCLKTVLEIEKKALKKSTEPLLAKSLSMPKASVSFLAPSPKPPVSARPIKFSVTSIETLIKDPYAIYVKKILEISPMKDFIEGLTPSDFGTIVHHALETFCKKYQNKLPEEPKQELLNLTKQSIKNLNLSEIESLFLNKRLEATFEWFLEEHKKRIKNISKILCEEKFEMDFNTQNNTYKLTCKADRIDVLKDNSLHLIDYKTGVLPKNKKIKAGFAPQLPLEIKILETSGIEDLNELCFSGVEYWRTRPKEDGGKIQPIEEKDIDLLSNSYFQKLLNLFVAYEDKETPYLAQPNAMNALDYNDYEHLGRYLEWASFDTQEEEEEEDEEQEQKNAKKNQKKER